MANCFAFVCLVIDNNANPVPCIWVNDDGSCGDRFYINPAHVICVRWGNSGDCRISDTQRVNGQYALVVVDQRFDLSALGEEAKQPRSLDEMLRLVHGESTPSAFDCCGMKKTVT